jgi:hypothetical protein
MTNNVFLVRLIEKVISILIRQMVRDQWDNWFLRLIIVLFQLFLIVIVFNSNMSFNLDMSLFIVTLKGKGSRKFRGFLIEPRPSADNYTTFGSLQSFPENTRNPCSNERANKVSLSSSDHIN